MHLIYICVLLIECAETDIFPSATALLSNHRSPRMALLDVLRAKRRLGEVSDFKVGLHIWAAPSDALGCWAQCSHPTCEVRMVLSSCIWMIPSQPGQWPFGLAGKDKLVLSQITIKWIDHDSFGMETEHQAAARFWPIPNICLAINFHQTKLGKKAKNPKTKIRWQKVVRTWLILWCWGYPLVN